MDKIVLIVFICIAAVVCLAIFGGGVYYVLPSSDEKGKGDAAADKKK